MTPGPAAIGGADAGAAALPAGAAACRSRSHRAPQHTFEDRRERSDRLRHAVFEDLEIRLRQILDRLPAPIAYHHVDEHRRDALFHSADGSLRFLRARECERQPDEQRDVERQLSVTENAS